MVYNTDKEVRYRLNKHGTNFKWYIENDKIIIARWISTETVLCKEIELSDYIMSNDPFINDYE